MDGFGRQNKCLFFGVLLNCHATIAASPLNLPQTKDNVIPLEPMV